ncbi:MAG: prepilin-type N-terminal cleavage/methylation domain-containing protein, partial [Gammaproteobacteria bacterium]|nr:prepilin-type N-terminal cleavage/methylation domain-containing protein [Gammaproteobacteria bacterium]
MQLKQFGYISRHTPRGFTLIELMISMLIMIIVSFITIYLAAGVFQANSWSIHMIQLTQELR